MVSPMKMEIERELSPNSDLRKISKPIMEKRRRARINACLSELKSLLLEVMKKDMNNNRYSKMEKADILEMAVRYLRQIQRQQFTVAATSDPRVVDKYHDGFSECANEVSRYLNSVDGMNPELKGRVLNHLASNVNGTQKQTQPITINNNLQPMQQFQATPITVKPVSVAQNNMMGTVTAFPTHQQQKVLQVMPSNENNQQMVFVMSGQPNTGYVIPVINNNNNVFTVTSSHNMMTSPVSAVPQNIMTSPVSVATAVSSTQHMMTSNQCISTPQVIQAQRILPAQHVIQPSQQIQTHTACVRTASPAVSSVSSYASEDVAPVTRSTSPMASIEEMHYHNQTQNNNSYQKQLQMAQNTFNAKNCNNLPHINSFAKPAERLDNQMKDNVSDSQVWRPW